MPWKYTDEYYTEYTRTTWNHSAEAYIEFMRTLEPYREDLVDQLKLRPGESVLDLGTGPGEPALTIARAVGAHGHVTGVDLSENMVAIARRIASSRGQTNVDFQAMDCSALSLPSSSFDAAVSSFGFQIFTDPEKAAKEAHRVLRPHGRIAVSVWGSAEKAPALDAIIGPMLRHAEPDETGYLPSPYETGGPGEMIEFLKAAGFRTARETHSLHEWRFADEDAYLNSVLAATPIGHSLSEEPENVQREVLQETREFLSRWKSPAGLVIPAEAVLVVAEK